MKWLGFIAAIAAPLSAYVGRWHSWSDLNPVKTMLEHRGRLFVGTLGGIRSVDPGSLAEKDFDNRSGLTDVRIVGLAEDEDSRLWAASRSGQLFRLEGEKWSAWGRSYMAEGWTVNDRAFIAVAGYLVVGSKNGLTFFDRKRGVAAANLTKFGPEGPQPVTGLVRVGDTLFIATGKTVLQAAVDWSNLLSTRFGTIFDPQIWKLSTGIASPLTLPALSKRSRDTVHLVRRANASSADAGAGGGGGDDTGGVDTVVIDTTVARAVQLAFLDGRVVAHDSGTMLSGVRRVMALRGRALVVDGKTYADSSYESASMSGGRFFLGGAKGLRIFSPDGPPFQALPAPVPFPQEQVATIAAGYGRAMVQTAEKVWELDGEGWKVRFDYGFVSAEILRNELRNLVAGPGNSMYMGTWGAGVVLQAPEQLKAWNALSDPACLKPVVDTVYTVVQGLDLRGNDMWIATLEDGHGAAVTTHLLSHLDIRTGKVTCPEFKGMGRRVVAVRVLNDSLLGVAGDAGIVIYKWRLKDGSVSGSQANTLKSDFGEVLGRGVALDSRGRLWALFSEQLGYVDSLSTRLTGGPMPVKFPSNIKVKTCRDMEVDARGELWVGCDNGLFHVRPGNNPDEPDVEIFTADNGLLSNRVIDVSVDKGTGDVWVVSESGINRLEGPSPPYRGGVSAVRAYPNPFLGKHSLLVIDNLPPGAEADVLTQSGSVVRHFRPSEMRGNQFQWDGNNASGRKVKPGIYFYSVSADGKGNRGKIIVAR